MKSNIKYKESKYVTHYTPKQFKMSQLTNSISSRVHVPIMEHRLPQVHDTRNIDGRNHFSRD